MLQTPYPLGPPLPLLLSCLLIKSAEQVEPRYAKVGYRYSVSGRQLALRAARLDADEPVGVMFLC